MTAAKDHNSSNDKNPSKDSVRMLVLETDEVHPETKSRRGSFGDIFDQLFQSAGKKHDPPLSIEVDMRFVVEPKGGKIPSMEDFEGYHAVLITGSMFDAHGDDEWIAKLMDLLKRMLVSFCPWKKSCKVTQQQVCGVKDPTFDSAACVSATNFSAACLDPRSNPSLQENGSSHTLQSPYLP